MDLTAPSAAEDIVLQMCAPKMMDRALEVVRMATMDLIAPWHVLATVLLTLAGKTDFVLKVVTLDTMDQHASTVVQVTVRLLNADRQMVPAQDTVFLDIMVCSVI